MSATTDDQVYEEMVDEIVQKVSEGVGTPLQLSPESRIRFKEEVAEKVQSVAAELNPESDDDWETLFDAVIASAVETQTHHLSMVRDQMMAASIIARIADDDLIPPGVTIH